MAKKRCLLALAVILLLGLIIPIPAIATPDVAEWSLVDIPTEGKSGNWVLADGSDVQHLTMAVDGTIYAYATPSGTSYTLFKTDEGRSWSYTDKVKAAIVDIATSPDDADVIYYATSSSVYRSTDAGSSFTPLTSKPGGAGSNNIEITAIDITPQGNDYIIAVGTRDTDSLEYGGVYILDENKPFANWVDTNLGNYDVFAVAFSPNFASDQQIVAVVTNETDTLVTTTIDGGRWGQTAGDTIIKDVTPNSAALALPSDYDSDVTTGDYIQFVAIDVGSDNGDVYRIEGVGAPNLSLATDLDIGSAYGLSNVDVTSLAVIGDGTTTYLLAGAANSAQVYYSTDGGTSWTTSFKALTGGSKTYVLMAADFASSGKAYASTSGSESALSYTTDGGVTWNQVGLIDTGISSIVDLAVSPSYSQDNTLFMLTWGSQHSLWRNQDGGTKWQRVFTSALANVDYIDKVKLSPNYNSSQVVFIAGSSNGNPAIWRSTDNGQSFTHQSVPFPIDIWVWAVVNNNTLFVGSFDDINLLGLVYFTTDSGSSYSTPAVVGSYQIHSIALSPNYDEDETILVGNTNGWVYWSNDNGSSFEPLPQDATSAPFTGSITVAFDPEYSTNNTIYAASDTADEGIYRFVIGTSTSWKNIDNTLPEGGMIGQLMISADGTLYATNFKVDGGMERSLNPTYSPGPTFETVTFGLDSSATLNGLWLSGNQLWSIDTYNTRLMTFADSLAVPVTLTSPPDQAPGIGTMIGSTIRDVSLNWKSSSDATSYQWQLDYNADFSTVPIPLEGDAEANSIRLTALESATTYFWRVRVTEPLLSPWSTSWSFTTSLGTTAVAPSLKSPGSGAKRVGLKPVFQWSATASADSYELSVSTNVSFASPVINKIGDHALPTTAWQSNISLNYDTTYYWKVRAISSSSWSAWSAVGAFTTEPEPAPESTPEPLSSPSTAPELYSPEAGASGVELKPIFQWSNTAGADSHELLVSTDASFINPLIAKVGTYALSTTAWQYDLSLQYNTTYYWKIRARSSDSYSAWSAVSAFTTKSLPTPTASAQPPSSPPPPPPPAQQTTPDWVFYMMGLMGFIVVLLLATILVVVARRR